VPLLTGLDPNVALFTAGAGTLLFQFITKRMVPVFLASSFAFIAPIIYGVQTWGIAATMCGLAAAGIFYMVLSILIRWRGVAVIIRILPPVVTGPVIMVIGLILAPVAVNMAMGKTGDGAAVLVSENTALFISMLSLTTTVLAISSVTGKNFLDNPGVHRTMMGDGLATSLASLLGGPPNTTYSEVTGAVALIRSFNPGIMTWAALFAVALSFVGKMGALLRTIPVPVMGGIMLLLFGAIMVVGLNSLVKAGQDLMEPRNMCIVSLILVFGIGGMVFSAGDFSIKGIGLAGILGVFLNLVLPRGRSVD
jgi:uracil permease